MQSFNLLRLSHFLVTVGANAPLDDLPVGVRKLELELEASGTEAEAALLAAALPVEEREGLGAIVTRHEGRISQQ